MTFRLSHGDCIELMRAGKAAEQAAEAALVSVSQKLHAIGGGPDAG